MTYAALQEISADWATYEKTTAELGDVKPAGLIAHVAGPFDGGVRMIDVWESKEAYDRFGNDLLLPAIKATGGSAMDPAVRTEVDVQHLLVG